MDPIGWGGNGQVWRGRSVDGDVAIKFLEREGAVARQRFAAEVEAMKRCADVDGVLHVLADQQPIETGTPDGHLPPWFAMPIAVPAAEVLHTASVADVVDAVLAWARTLVVLHERGISHRDIKPPNLFRLGERWVLGDFGLVEFPEKVEVTRAKESLGPWAIMPPEMRRDAQHADGARADVYLLAKTLWMLLTHDLKGFDGPFLATDHGLSLEVRFGPNAFVHPLEDWLTVATQNDPARRPSMSRLAEVLVEWTTTHGDFFKRSNADWSRALSNLISVGGPQRVIWEDLDDIVTVLSHAARYDQATHLFYPSGGGNDLEGVRRAGEPDCIEIHAATIAIVRPRRLLLEMFRGASEWNYLRLETGDLESCGANEVLSDDDDDDQDLHHDETNDEQRVDPRSAYEIKRDARIDAQVRMREEVTEVRPGEYVSASSWDDDDAWGEDEYGDPLPRPQSARRVTRYFRGDFIIFGKGTPYNLKVDTYRGDHAVVSTDEFRRQIEQLATPTFAPIAGRHASELARDAARIARAGSAAPVARFEGIVLDVIRLARERRKEPANGGLLRKGKKLDSPAEAALRNFLRALAWDDLRKLLVLMYSGRDDESMLTEHRHLAEESSAVTASIMRGKVPLDEYLLAGLRRAERDGVDLEEPLPARKDLL